MFLVRGRGGEGEGVFDLLDRLGWLGLPYRAEKRGFNRQQGFGAAIT